MYSQKAILGALGLCVAGVVGVVAVDFKKNNLPLLKPAEARAENGSTLSSSLTTTVRPLDATRVLPEAAPSKANEHTDQSHSTPEEVALDANVLRASLEDSLFGKIDPNIYLNAALALTDLEVGDVLPAHPSGATRFPVLNTPEGISAELWIGNLRPESEYKSARSYVIYCEPPEDQYFVEGAVRSRSKAQVSVWTDLDGRAKYFGVLTEMEVSAETLRLGLTLDRVPTGIHYTFDVENPLEVVGQQNGIANGAPGAWKNSPLILAGSILLKEDIELLGAAMQSAHKDQ